MISKEARELWLWIHNNGGSARVVRSGKRQVLHAHTSQRGANKQAISDLTAAGHIRHFGERIEVNTWPV